MGRTATVRATTTSKSSGFFAMVLLFAVIPGVGCGGDGFADDSPPDGATPDGSVDAATANADAADDEGDAEQTTLTLVLPDTAVVGVPAAFSGSATGAIERVVVTVDGWQIADQAVVGGGFAFDYRFTAAGDDRLVVATGLDAAAQEVDRVSDLLDVTGTGSYVSGVPYFYQYDNAINPGGSCQNTSMAMVLRFYGASDETPDRISQQYGTSQAQSVSGFQQVFDAEAAAYGLPWRDAGTTTGTLDQLHAQLAAGFPVVVHGYFTSSGHVIVLVGFDGDVYWANDPAGEWNQVYMGGGYSGADPSEGYYVTYDADAVDAAIAPDGWVWMHAFYSL